LIFEGRRSLFNLWYLYKRRTPQKFEPVVLVTGCSSGIGWALTEFLYTEKRYRVVVTARKSSLENLRKTFPENERFWIRPLDVTSTEEQEVLFQEIHEKWEGVNILINNAGISYRSVLEHMTEEAERHQMAINYFGPVALIRRVMPYMREQGRGKIINVSSVSGMLAMPTMASYSASKYALEGMSEALWYEAKPLGINVSLIQPGFVRSNSFRNVYYTKMSNPQNGYSGAYGDYYAYMSPFIEKLMKLSLTNPYSVARLIMKVIRTENPPLWIPATVDAKIFYYLRRIVPRRLFQPLLFMALPSSWKWSQGYTNRRGKDRRQGERRKKKE
jgi:short-subunit dehydrogenase